MHNDSPSKLLHCRSEQQSASVRQDVRMEWQAFIPLAMPQDYNADTSK